MFEFSMKIELKWVQEGKGARLLTNGLTGLEIDSGKKKKLYQVYFLFVCYMNTPACVCKHYISICAMMKYVYIKVECFEELLAQL